MTALIKYEAACYAIQIAWQVDEAKDIRDKALAMQAYARQAKNTKMIQQATEIRLRAERRCGELLNGSERNKGAATPKINAVATDDRVPKTLEEIGLTKQQSSDFQALASVPKEVFEQEVATGKASTRSLVEKSPKRKSKALKEAKAPKPKKEKAAPDPAKCPNRDTCEVVQEHEAIKERCQDLTDELKTAVAVMGTDAAIEMQKLREEVRYANRKKNELMARTVEMEKQIKFWRKAAEKLGWKPEKRIA